MGLLNEALQAPSGLQAALDAGVDNLSINQTVVFTQYTKIVLSQDGYVFWIASPVTQSFKGSLHRITDRHQDDDQTVAANRFIFTAQQEVTALNTISPGTMWVGSWPIDGTTLQIVFSDHGSFYQQADLWHYSGYAVYPALASQLVASAADLPVEPIVSNSLPIWLAQNTFAPIYPSFLVPDNVTPPYIVVHIEPEQTVAFGGSFPIDGWPGTPAYTPGSPQLYDLPTSQLMRDTVKFIIYGFNNQLAIQFTRALMDVSIGTPELFGFCSDVTLRDEKRTQVEIASLAMKKTLTFQASYYQGTADAIARRLILSASCSVNT